MVRPYSGPEERDAFAESIYREQVKPMLTDADDGKFVVIDLNSGDYEVDDYEFDAEIRLLERRPGAATYPFFWRRAVPHNLHRRGLAEIGSFALHRTQRNRSISEVVKNGTTQPHSGANR